MLRLHTLSRLELLEGDPPATRIVAVQPKRLGLLAYLAVARPRGFHARDTLLALFWPDLNDSEARRALRQAIHYLKGALGEGAILTRPDDRIALADGPLWCDAVVMEQAADAGDLDRAVALYQGDFLAGVHLTDAAPEFEEWISATRRALRERGAALGWVTAEREEQAGRREQAVRAARWAVTLAPDDEDALRRLMALLERAGDRAGALQAYQVFAARMAKEFGTTPSPETRGLIARLTPAGGVASPVPLAGAAPVAATAPRRRTRALAAAAAVVGVVSVTGVLLARARGRPAPPIIAVGVVTAPSGADTSLEARALPELLATNLSRLPAMRVVARGRVFEMLAQVGAQPDSPGALTEAMRRAGAAEAVEGVLYRTPDRPLRLDLRRVDLATGLVRRSYTVEARDAFELADRAAAAVAASFRLPAPATPVAEVTSTSLAALRLYDEGLRAAYLGDRAAAARLFRAALEADSTFAMAAYMAGTSLPVDREHAEERVALVGLAARLAPRVADRDRFVIQYQWAIIGGDSRTALAYAESLAVRFPDDPESQMVAGQAYLVQFDAAAAVRSFRRAVALDSQSLAAERGRCVACNALAALVLAHGTADSFPAAERTVRWWLERQPRSAPAWYWLAFTLRIQDRFDEAAAAMDRAVDLEPAVADPTFEAAFAAIYREDYAEADRRLGERMRGASTERAQHTRWWQIISLRNQGRLAEALAAAREYERLLPPVETPSTDSVAVAQVLFEQGRYGEAVRRFLALSAVRGPTYERFPGLAARFRAWFLTHAATALAAAGDTARLAALADTIERHGARSGTARDVRLHHHVRGLLWNTRGRTDSAVAAFQRAMGSPTFGYTRTNLELGRLLVRVGRPRDAIPLLRAGLRGVIETNNYYVTRTELREALAQAYQAAGVADSAAAQYRIVAQSWSAGDPALRPRAAVARQRSGSS